MRKQGKQGKQARQARQARKHESTKATHTNANEEVAVEGDCSYRSDAVGLMSLSFDFHRRLLLCTLLCTLPCGDEVKLTMYVPEEKKKKPKAALGRSSMRCLLLSGCRVCSMYLSGRNVRGSIWWSCLSYVPLPGYVHVRNGSPLFNSCSRVSRLLPDYLIIFIPCPIAPWR